MTPEQRYQRDTQFHLLVDMMVNQIIQCNYTPSELRDAAMLAAIQYETRYARPVYQFDGSSMSRMDAYHARLRHEAYFEAGEDLNSGDVAILRSDSMFYRRRDEDGPKWYIDRKTLKGQPVLEAFPIPARPARPDEPDCQTLRL